MSSVNLPAVFTLLIAEPNDYPQVVSRVITFPGSRLGGIEECTPIDVVDDGIDETPDTEDFFLDLTPGTNSAIGNPDRATVTIIDDRKFSKSGLTYCFTK